MSDKKNCAMMKNKLSRVRSPKLRLPQFEGAGPWNVELGGHVFDQINNKDHNSDIPVLAISQEHGAIPRNLINYHVSATEESIESYKVVEIGDFIISLRSFQGGIEFSKYHGICSPAYVVLRLKGNNSAEYFRHYFKTSRFIAELTKNLEGLRDGKMISYKQFSELRLAIPPSIEEQERIAEHLSLLENLIEEESRKLSSLRRHKKGLVQQLFPCNSDAAPKLRFSEYRHAGNWARFSIGDLVERGVLYAPRDGNHGNLHPKASDYVSDGIPFIMASDIRHGKINYTNCAFISKEQADLLQKGFAKEGDVLLTHKGTVGAVAMVDRNPYPYVMLTPQVTYYRVRNDKELLNNFLAHSFTTDDFQSSLLVASGGGTRAYIGITEQAKLSIALPAEISEQQRISDALAPLDELIIASIEKIDLLRMQRLALTQGMFPAMGEESE